MEIVLLERIEKLGQMGDVIKVRPGYARNYLLPQQKALRATKENIAYFQRKRTQLETVNLKRREEAAAVAARMDGLSLFIVRQAGESGQLYGSVTARDIAESVTETGFPIQRHQVQLSQAIKTLGATVVWVVLHPEVVVSITITIGRSIEERGEELEAGAGEDASSEN
ncbi:LSU ribosomal protein L9p [invertebrate metagenome]|uniref:LSU ribosomal protein L9p n=1 Tax=invertebrate metagenome TaxID=1711999 RepID=A0A484H804_9ZZZZ